MGRLGGGGGVIAVSFPVRNFRNAGVVYVYL
jgi:hypothetical protein